MSPCPFEGCRVRGALHGEQLPSAGTAWFAVTGTTRNGEMDT